VRESQRVESERDSVRDKIYTHLQRRRRHGIAILRILNILLRERVREGETEFLHVLNHLLSNWPAHVLNPLLHGQDHVLDTQHLGVLKSFRFSL